MFKKNESSNGKFLKRRKFLSGTAAVGGMAAVGASAGPFRAAQALTGDSADVENTSPERRGFWQGNATVDDFTGLVGQDFRFVSEAGIETRATLIEANAPAVRRAPRFRREHFAIVFDVPREIELVQGHYRVSHPRIGTMNLFMVPVDLPAKTNRLEAIFA